MSTDTRHPQYPDHILQAAIDAACNETAESYPITSRLLTLQDYKGSYYVTEAPARLTLARELLERLPEPTPPVWQPAVGDVVRLKSGGPAMTVIKWCEEYKVWDCGWFVKGEYCTDSWAAACLVSAREAQP